MTPVLVLCLMLGSARALVDLSCSDNATCIENLGRDLVQSLREKKAVRLFETFTIEPLSRRQGRSSGGIWGMMEDHAMSFDWGDYTFRISVPKDGRDDALDLELYESRAVKEEPDPSPKKTSSKVEDEKGDEPPTPKRGIRRRRRQKKKVIQALIPLMFGMKSAGVVIFAFALVTVLTLKAFMASKMALIVTIGMALKRLYDSYGITGIPETSNVLWTIARYFKMIFGSAVPPLSQPTMTMPMYLMPQMPQMQEMPQMMYDPTMNMPPTPE